MRASVASREDLGGQSSIVYIKAVRMHGGVKFDGVIHDGEEKETVSKLSGAERGNGLSVSASARALV